MNEYAAYKNDELVCIGTVGEVAEALGVTKKTVYYYTTPAYQKRRKADHWLTVFRVDDDDA